MAYRDRARGFVNEAQDFLSGGNLGESQDLIDRITGLYEGLQAPTYEQLYGQDLQAEQLGPSELGNLNVDPSGLAAAQQALAGLQSIYGEGGLNAIDRAKMANIEAQQAAQQRAIQQTMSDGRDSGFRQAQGLVGSQGAANRAYGQGTNVAAMALQRSQDALQQAGGLGLGMQQQQFGQEAQKASARDAFNKFNAMNRQDVAAQNLQRQNAARLNAFQTAYQRLGGLSDAYRGQAGMKQNLGQSQLQGLADIGEGAINAAGLIGTGGASGGMKGFAQMFGAARNKRGTDPQGGW